MELFCSIVKIRDDICFSAQEDHIVTQAMQCIHRMELASLRRFSQLALVDQSNEQTRRILFFTPTEELNGSNIFSKLSNHYSVMQPYLEIIDSDFIH